MKHSRNWAVALIAVALLFPATLSAQLLSKGSVSGTVLDATGAVVPDAKVTLSSEAFGTRETTSGPDGTFLFLALEPGKYTVKVEKAGFKVAEVKDVDVRLNERASIQLKLDPGALTQTIEVTDASIGVDPSTTTTGGSITANIFKNAPVGRNITDIPYLVAGVNDSLGVGAANPSISGATGFENLYIVNGVNITNTGYGAIGTYSNVFGSLGSGVQFDFVKEVQVKTSGFEAQYGQALGGVVNMITKSGGNALHGSGYFYASPTQFEALRRQPNSVRFNQGTETLGVSGYDLGGDIGGYIVKDRVFWYGGYNVVWSRIDFRGPSNFLSRTLLGTYTQPNRIQNYSGKLNFNLTADQRHQVEASIFGDPSKNAFGPNRGLVSDFPDRRFSELNFGSRNFAARYNGAITNNWLVNGSFSWAWNEFKETGFPNLWQVEDRTEITAGGTNPLLDGLPTPTTNRGINQVGGIGFLENNNANNRQYAVNGTNLFRFWGSHQVDYGYQFEDVEYSWFHRRSGPNWAVPCFDRLDNDVNLVGGAGTASPDCGLTNFGASLRLRTGGPSGFRLQQVRGAFAGDTGTTNTDYHAVYLQDGWQLNKYITAKLGLRWEQQRIQGENLGYTFVGNWAPRLGVIVDPWGDRRTKMFFNFARVFEKVPQDLAVRSLSEERQYIGFFFVVPNPGSANATFNTTVNPTAGCPASTPNTPQGIASCLHNPANWFLDEAHNNTVFPFFSGGVTNFARGTKAQYQDEYVVGVEREFPGGIIVSARYLDRRIKRVVEDVAALTVGAGNTGVDWFGNEIHQSFLIGNPSSSLDLFINTLCFDGSVLPGMVTGEDPTVEDPNSTFGCLNSSLNSPADSGYNPGAGNPGADGRPDGFPNPVRKYKSFELVVEKRLSKNWQIHANWRISKLTGNYEGLFRNDNGQTDPNISSLFDFPFSTSLGDQFNPGVLPTDRRHIVNVSGSYLFDNGINLGVGWRTQSGYPIDRLGAHPGYLNQGEVPKNGRGSEGRSPITTEVNLQTGYTWKVTERYRLKLAVDLFNLFNTKEIRRIDRNEDTGFVTGQVPPVDVNADFLKATGAADAYQRPIYARFSVRLEF